MRVEKQAKLMIYGYVRVSTQEQNLEGQKNLISRYGMDHKLMVDE
jgi:DNA invertase Pin-like site-specific DNA recombinase